MDLVANHFKAMAHLRWVIVQVYDIERKYLIKKQMTAQGWTLCTVDDPWRNN